MKEKRKPGRPVGTKKFDVMKSMRINVEEAVLEEFRTFTPNLSKAIQDFMLREVRKHRKKTTEQGDDA